MDKFSFLASMHKTLIAILKFLGYFLIISIYTIICDAHNIRNTLGKEPQTIIFENNRVERVKATLYVIDPTNRSLKSIYQYSIPPRREAHQPAYAHRVFHIGYLPAILTVKIRSQRRGGFNCEGRFLIKETHYLFNHHPYVRISTDTCQLGKRVLAGSHHLIKRYRGKTLQLY